MFSTKSSCCAIAILVAAPLIHLQPAYAITEAEARRRIVPYIRALTDCIALHIRINEKPLAQARTGNWSEAIGTTIRFCDVKWAEMIRAHDQFLGQGTGLIFYKGSYLADLPRALQTRLQGEFDSAERNERELAVEKLRRDAESLEAKKKLVAETVAQHEDCLISALTDLTVNSSESAPVLVDVAMDRCSKFAERRISIGVAAFEMTREEAKTIVDNKMKEMRTKMITAVVTARAEAAKRRDEGSGSSSPANQSLPKALPL